ncbi:class I SAM-dependent methyltransferase [Bifidobacterium longum]|uniref:class I SAM-dependent methyltransferase n=1 Tax=Bifidobacterium longum TaxID=216816 RepID=UPI003D7FA4D2
MEYSKEDLMEAKKQIWGVGENMGTEESKKIWEENAQFWDNAMGDESNEFHREVVRPKVTELLSPNPADYILDIACGNGNYSSYLAQRGASVVAFDYSKKMIELAKRRQSQYAKQIEFCVADATDRKSILELKRNGDADGKLDAWASGLESACFRWRIGAGPLTCISRRA